jgi:mannose-1-phosphate guanylyltransferase
MLKCNVRSTCMTGRSNNETLTTLLPRVSLLLAGGDGTRLQDLTRALTGAPIPKQYCRLLHGSSLLETTISRAHFFSPRDQISVIVNENHLALAEEQLKPLPKENVYIQPLNRDTGPGLIFSLLNIERRYSDAIVAAFPTDHYIENNELFMDHALRAAEIISEFPDKIAILGVAPDRPETGYGYILPAGVLDDTNGVYQVETFTEKPDFQKALALMERGGLWNTFVMIFRLSRMFELLKAFVPDRFSVMSALRNAHKTTSEIYSSLEPWNLSTGFLARIPQHLIVVKTADVGWSDWGTRESIERTYRTLNIVPFWNHPNTAPVHAGAYNSTSISQKPNDPTTAFSPRMGISA